MLLGAQSSLLTDFYQFTMAYGYWSLGMAEREAVFHLYYREAPFSGKYVLCCGLSHVIDFLQQFCFRSDDLEYLQSLQDKNGQALFSEGFLDYLADLHFTCDVIAVPEGELVFPHEPMLRIKGPLLQCQLLETPLINFINLSSLIATKASRICTAADGDDVIDFSLRRSHGPDAGLIVSRASYIGGVSSSSNTLAGKSFGLPVNGTMAHSWVMVFSDELSSFISYAKIWPKSTVMLVDTIDTVSGVYNAIKAGKLLRESGHDLVGVRLDSGDLHALSLQVRQILDEAGFQRTKIVASGNLDEYQIAKLKACASPIDVWGVGTRLATAYDQPSLDVSYKLGAAQDENGKWQHKMKRSDLAIKTTDPGILQLRRFYKQKRILHDMVYDELLGASDELFSGADEYRDLLVPIFKRGKLVYQQGDIANIREFSNLNLQNHDETHTITRELEPRLLSLKQSMLDAMESGHE